MNILPKTYKGSPRHMQQQYQNSLALVRAFHSKPDLFITVTANPEWPEITEAINKYPNQRNINRDDIIARVFQIKLQELLNDILQKHVLGVVVAHTYVVEFQKRGLPHAHILLILHPDSKLDRDPQLYDKIISAQIPNPETHPRLHELVAKHMIHGPCKFYKSCLKNGSCIKHFPKDFQPKTVNNKDGFAVYKRLAPKDGGFTCKCKWRGSEFVVHNGYVVPYNAALLLKYNCHINVEYCATIASIKYLYKYIYKGSDKTFISIEERQTNIIKECDDFIEFRYFGAAEACWRIFEFKLNKIYPTVQALPVHLPQKQMITFNENKNQDVEDYEPTELTEYFANNKKEQENNLTVEQLGEFQDGTVRPHGFQLLYHEYPQFYRWKKKQWFRRTPNRYRLKPKISRMHYVNFAETERYFLRVLLLKQTGKTSFDDLKTVNKDEGPCKTFKETCMKLGYLEDDSEFYACLKEACEHIASGYSLRKLFATILNLNEVLEPAKLWEKFKDELTSDIKYNYYKQHPDPTNNKIYTQKMYNEALFQIENMLMDTIEKIGTLSSYGLPEPNRDDRLNLYEEPRNIRNELQFDKTAESKIVDKNVNIMNKKQKCIYRQIINAVYTEKKEKNKNFFFMQASAGTGKTFVASTIASKIRSNGHIALCNATSGIAATLFVNGKTMHSRFKIPLNCTKNSALTIKRQSADAELIRQAKIIIWDEAPMAHSNNLFWLNRQLQDIMDNDELFGGKILVLSGDFKQIPPVVPKASYKVIIQSSIKNCSLFDYATQLVLTRNERLRKQINEGTLNEDEKNKLTQFDAWISKIGAGSIENKYTDIDESLIEIPENFVVKSQKKEDMVDIIYPNLNEYNNNPNYFLERCILTPLNNSVDAINNICLKRIEHETEVIYKSQDSVGLDDTGSLFSQEFLNSRDFPGVPKHELRLKTNIPIMLLRNIDSDNGLCNGTRLIIKKLHNHLLECVKLTDPEETVLIPRMTLQPSTLQLGYEFKRKQFPIRIAFAMTINKSQGQTLNKTMIYLPKPVFQHGQLYVAVSRVTNPENLKFFIRNTDNQGYIEKYQKYVTKNIVYKSLIIK